jgi:hypothetical protein
VARELVSETSDPAAEAEREERERRRQSGDEMERQGWRFVGVVSGWEGTGPGRPLAQARRSA